MATPTKSATPKILTVEETKEGAKNDIKDDIVTDVFGGAVRIRGLTASQGANLKKQCIAIGGARSGGGVNFDYALEERLKFRYGVIEPKYQDDDVREIHMTAGPSFQKVLKAIDELSGTDKKELDAAEAEFQDGDDV